MVSRQKNLLEAFTASANAEKASGEELHPSGSPSGGPFAPEPRGQEERPRASLTDTLLHPENRGGLLALVGVLVVLSFLAGRMTADGGVPAAGTVQASPGSATEPARAVLPAAQAAVPEAVSPDPSQVPATPAEKALTDPRNKYTIKLVEYSRGRDEDLAWNTIHYLEDLGLPVVSIYRGQRQFLVLGAAPRQVDLDDLLQRAKTMNGPPPRSKQNEFFDAYVEKIDNLFDR